MPDHPAALALNHLLAREAWARERLRAFAGQQVRFRAPAGPELVLEIRASGEVMRPPLAREPDLTITLKPGALPLALARDDRLLREIEIVGNPELAAAVQFLFKHLRWDLEEDLARLVGDVVAHRLMNAGKSLARWQADAGRRLGENMSEYLKEEAGALARPEDVRGFARDVAELRDAVERLEQRVARLESRD